jgi:hypothetical protein
MSALRCFATFANMKISEAVSPAAPVAVQFARGVLNVEYRPSSMTFAEMEEMLAAAEEAKKAVEDSGDEAAALRPRLDSLHRRFIENAVETIVTWDLTDEEENVIPLTEEALRNVPMNIFTEIQKAIRAHQSAGDSGKS